MKTTQDDIDDLKDLNRQILKTYQTLSQQYIKNIAQSLLSNMLFFVLGILTSTLILRGF